MSVLNKKPYAQKVVESLGQADLETLASAINGLEPKEYEEVEV